LRLVRVRDLVSHCSSRSRRWSAQRSWDFWFRPRAALRLCYEKFLGPPCYERTDGLRLRSTHPTGLFMVSRCPKGHEKLLRKAWWAALRLAHPDMDDGCNLYFICPLLLIDNSLGPRLQEPPRMGPTVTRRRRLEAAGNSILVFLFWRSGAAITTVDQSDIRGLGTGLS